MSYLTTIARATGWGRRYILWELPYATGLGICHAEAMHHGQAMVFCERREQRSPAGGGMSVREQMATVRARAKAAGTGGEGLTGAGGSCRR